MTVINASIYQTHCAPTARRHKLKCVLNSDIAIKISVIDCATHVGGCNGCTFWYKLLWDMHIWDTGCHFIDYPEILCNGTCRSCKDLFI